MAEILRYWDTESRSDLFQGLGSLLTRFSAKIEKYALKSSAMSLTSKLAD